MGTLAGAGPGACHRGFDAHGRVAASGDHHRHHGQALRCADKGREASTPRRQAWVHSAAGSVMASRGTAPSGLTARRQVSQQTFSAWPSTVIWLPAACAWAWRQTSPQTLRCWRWSLGPAGSA
jgi:hypothetical protein